MATKNDKVVFELQKKIAAKEALLKKSERFAPITNCLLELDGQRYNINVLTKDQLAHLIVRLSTYSGVANNIGFGNYSIAGFPIQDWITDLTAKHANLDRKMEEQRLAGFKKELHDMLSSDTKAEIKLSEIAEAI